MLQNISISDSYFQNCMMYNMIISPSHYSKNLGLSLNSFLFYKLSFKIYILHSLQNPQTFIYSELKKYGPHLPETYLLYKCLDHSTTTSHQSSHMWQPFSLRCQLCVVFIIHKYIYNFTPIIYFGKACYYINILFFYLYNYISIILLCYSRISEEAYKALF